MPNYQESPIAGTSWTRSVRLICDNPLNGRRGATFVEERAISLGDGQVITQPLGAFTEPLTGDNMNEAFNLLNPVTGEVVGSTTYAQAYAMLHSLYMHAAAKRDAAQ